MPPALFLVKVIKNMNTILGIKHESKQAFTPQGERIPVTRISAGPCYVVGIKNSTKDGYTAVQLGLGERKHTNKPLVGQIKGAKLKQAPKYLKEVRVDSVADYHPGDKINLNDIIKAGDKISVTGWSKGKGFAGVVKRWGFKGGPKTHGQSDRQRSPGAIGQRTTPGRVYRGKKMAGRMGGERVSIKGLTVFEIKEDNNLWVRGLVPGRQGGLLLIKRENA